MQKRLSLTIVVLLTPLLAPLLFGTEPFVFDQEDIGRILYHRAGKNDGENFLILDKIITPDRLECHVLGQTSPITVAAKEVRAKMIFFDGVPPFHVTQYALFGYMNGHSNSHAVKLARAIGDTSGRMDVVARYEQELRMFSQKLEEEMRYSEEKKHAPAIHDDNMQMMLEDSPPVEIIRKAADNHDFLLAAALAQDYFQQMGKNLRRYFQTANGRSHAQALFSRQKNELCGLFAEHVRETGERRSRFRQILPQARGLWSEAPPADYEGLLKVMRRSHQSLEKLDELSRFTNFQDWGNAMLDVLLVVEKSPAARELEEEFDRAIREKTGAAAPNNSNNRNP